MYCHCGKNAWKRVYDRCSRKYIKQCRACGCRYKTTGELEPNILCKQKGAAIQSEMTHYNQNLAPLNNKSDLDYLLR